MVSNSSFGIASKLVPVTRFRFNDKNNQNLKRLNRLSFPLQFFKSDTKFYCVTLFGRNVYFLVYMMTHWKHALFPCAHEPCFHHERSRHLSSYISHASKCWTTVPLFLSVFSGTFHISEGWCTCNCFHKTSLTRDLCDVQLSVGA